MRDTDEEKIEELLEELLVKCIVDRFLAWNLPIAFNPDAGIAFNPSEHQKSSVHPWPIGTNLLNAEQATEMVRYLLNLD